MVGVGRRDRRHAIDGPWLQELRPCTTRIKQVELAAAVDADPDLDWSLEAPKPRIRLERFSRRLDVRDFETEVVGGAAPVARRIYAREHQLVIVLTLGQAPVDPREGFRVSAAAAREFAEGKFPGVEVERRVNPGDNDPGVHYPVGDLAGI